MISIHQASPSDLDTIEKLFSGYLAFYQRKHEAAAIRQFLGDRIANKQSIIYIANSDGKALGFTQLYPAFASLSLRPSWILNDLFVVPDARGMGVANALMAAARQLATETNACEIFLQTARSNHQAQALYEKLNYQRDDEFLVYTLSIPSPPST
ncbi:MAG: GNAT family N-acetyltransferase [Arenimonas sp.]